MKNPFSLTFGKEPLSLISRNLQNEEIISSFKADNPDYQVCMITGVRGSGKTVAMTTIANELRQDENWLVVDLNPERDLLNALAAELSTNKDIFAYLKNAQINISAFGFGVGISGEQEIKDVTVLLNTILENITKENKRILVTIDEVTANKNIKEFVSQFQIFIRKNYNVFLLMTGLYENIYDLQNEKSLTFLYRAPKIELKPLSIPLIMQKYKEIFALKDEQALAMAKLTEGYPFAYQVLGYLCFKNKTSYEKVLFEFDSCLEEYVYEKIWSELSSMDKVILAAMAKSSSTKVASIREAANLDSNIFNVYRKRLLKKGVVRTPEYGHLAFSLPRFREFVLRNCSAEC